METLKAVPNVGLPVLCIAAVSVLLVLAYIHYFVVPKLIHRKFPGPPPTSFFFGNVREFTNSRPGSTPATLLDMARKYGQVHQMWLFNRRVVIVNNPLDARFLALTKNYKKSPSFCRPLEAATGKDSLLIVGKELHRSQRRHITKTFNASFLQDMRRHLSHGAEELVRDLERRAKETSATSETPNFLDFDEVIIDTTMDAISRAVCGEVLQGPIRKSMATLLKEVYRKQVSYPVSIWKAKFFKSSDAEFRKHRTICEAGVDEIVQRRKTEPAEQREKRPQDLLDIFMEYPEGDLQQIRSQMLTFFVAGHDTTAHSTSFMFYELSAKPDVVAKMRSEIQEVIGDVKTMSIEEAIDPSKMHKLLYCNQVWQEALRLHPAAATGTLRETEEACTLPDSGLYVPRGTDVLMPPYVVHRLEEYWGPDVDEFNPDRFSREAVRKRGSLAALQFMPFSIGPRNCVGQFVATYEALALITVLVPRFNFELACDRSAVREFHALTMKPRSMDEWGRKCALPMRVSMA